MCGSKNSGASPSGGDGSGAASKGPWACGVCTMVNEATQTCQACGSPRPHNDEELTAIGEGDGDAEEGDGWKEGDGDGVEADGDTAEEDSGWTCSSCDNVNSEGDAECSLCGEAFEPFDVSLRTSSSGLNLRTSSSSVSIIVTQLVDMGFPLNRAKAAAAATGGQSLEEAMEWAIAHIEDVDELIVASDPSSNSSESKVEAKDANIAAKTTLVEPKQEEGASETTTTAASPATADAATALPSSERLTVELRRALHTFLLGRGRRLITRWIKQAEAADDIARSVELHSHLALLHSYQGSGVTDASASAKNSKQMSVFLGSCAYVVAWHGKMMEEMDDEAGASGKDPQMAVAPNPVPVHAVFDALDCKRRDVLGWAGSCSDDERSQVLTHILNIALSHQNESGGGEGGAGGKEQDGLGAPLERARSTSSSLPDDLAGSASDGPLWLPVSTQTICCRRVLESEHPCQAEIDTHEWVEFPGAAQITIVFDERSTSDISNDYVTFFKDASHDGYWGGRRRFGGKLWPGVAGQPPIVIPTDRFQLHWHSGGTSKEWGFRFTATAPLSAHAVNELCAEPHDPLASQRALARCNNVMDGPAGARALLREFADGKAPEAWPVLEDGSNTGQGSSSFSSTGGTETALGDQPTERILRGLYRGDAAGSVEVNLQTGEVYLRNRMLMPTPSEICDHDDFHAVFGNQLPYCAVVSHTTNRRWVQIIHQGSVYQVEAWAPAQVQDALCDMVANGGNGEEVKGQDQEDEQQDGNDRDAKGWCVNMPRRGSGGDGAMSYLGATFAPYTPGSCGWISTTLDEILLEAVSRASIDRPVELWTDEAALKAEKTAGGIDTEGGEVKESKGNDAATAAATSESSGGVSGRLLMYVSAQGEADDRDGHPGMFYEVCALPGHRILHIYALLEEGRRARRSLVFTSHCSLSLCDMTPSVDERAKPWSRALRHAAGNIFTFLVDDKGMPVPRAGSGPLRHCTVSTLRIRRTWEDAPLPAVVVEDNNDNGGDSAPSGAAGAGAAGGKSPIANLQGRCTMGDLKEDFKYNESMKEKIEEMSVEYSGYRPIRGDGNCYYRAVSFSFLERALHAGEAGKALLRNFLDLVSKRDFNGHKEAEASRAYVCSRIEEWVTHDRWSWETLDNANGNATTTTRELKGAGRTVISSALQRSFVEDEGMDKGMIRVLRHATSSYIREHREDPMPSGMTYDMTVTLGMDFPSLDKYFDDMLEKMGEDAAAVVHVALPEATGITVRMEYLDRRAGVEQKAYDFPEDDQPRHAFILIKPGHFDMLYAKADDALPAAAPMASAGGLEEYISPRCARGLLPDAILEDYELWQRDASTVMGYPRSKKGKAGSQVGGSGESLHIKLHRQAKGGDADGGQAGITEHTATVVRTTENGDEELLLNVLGAAPGSALHRLGLLFSRLDNLSHILVWSSSKPRSFAEAGLESKGGESNESKDATPAAAAGVKEDVVISRVELPRLRLSFGVKAGPGGVPKLFSMDHDGLFVSMGGDKKQEMYAAHTRGLPHALIMENSNEQLYLLVPNYVPRRVKVGECPFSTDVVFDRSEEWRSSVKSRCYVYVRFINTLLNDCLEPCRRSARMMLLTT